MSPRVNSGVSDEIKYNDKLGTQAVGVFKYKILYVKLGMLIYMHIAGIYGIYLCFTEAQLPTIIFNFILYICSMLGTTAGYHRLWTHKAYKAKLPLEIILMFFSCLNYQGAAIRWVRDHRMHHKHCDTDGDPHNTLRGFFFSHIGWSVIQKHPDVIEKGKTLDFSDIYSNPILRFQKKYIWSVHITFTLLLPTVIPMYFWAESLSCAWYLNILRLVIFLQVTLCVNSIAHFWGFKPYDKRISSTQNTILSVVTLGEGFHNYHHVFPHDYRAAELGSEFLNITTLFIDMMAKIGWAYDLKFVDEESIKSRQLRTGDGTVDKYSESDKKMAALRRIGN